MNYRLICADVLEGLRQLPDESVQCVITSPPYWSLRDYGVKGQLGLERSPAHYVRKMVAVFAEVRRVLRGDGTLWLNIGDCYIGGYHRAATTSGPRLQGAPQSHNTPSVKASFRRDRAAAGGDAHRAAPRLKEKDLVGIPWRLALALQDDGWYLRSDIIWHKPNPMPESVVDRPTRAHEYLFLLSRKARYHYDADAIREPLAEKTFTTFGSIRKATGDGSGLIKAENYGKDVPVRRPRLKTDDHPYNQVRGFNDRWDASEAAGELAGANKRTVWTVATQPFAGAHFAVFPEKLVEPCILAGSKPGDMILDPFAGSGTTGVVALSHQRNFVGIEINPEYAEMARRRLDSVAPLFTQSERKEAESV